MADFTIKQRDLLPWLEATIFVGNTPVDLTGVSSVKLVLAARLDPSIAVFIGNAIVIAPSAGKVRYVWQAGDTDVAGEFVGEWHVTWPGNTPQKFPTVGQFSLLIEASLPDALPPP